VRSGVSILLRSILVFSKGLDSQQFQAFLDSDYGGGSQFIIVAEQECFRCFRPHTLELPSAVAEDEHLQHGCFSPSIAGPPSGAILMDALLEAQYLWGSPPN
jgi:hypothetical protein